MSEVWLAFIKKINLFSQKIIKYFSFLVKNVISGGKSFSKRSIDNFEVNKVKWDLKRHKQELGDNIYKSNTEDNTFNFSGDENFDKIIKKIKENKNFINNENNKIEI